ncbi:aminopeptidase N-like isoform X4 [Mytilus californianus]|uniref:aminopeptidase N-like isoform X4 n=2 Tax=Mytilus californianus TaxID=6549 RepID=UPI002247CB41|nr:aminopeptidase N-like isoform X4 [Mytilus californianus]
MGNISDLRKRGCFVTNLTGFLLVILVICLLAVVAVIVYFTTLDIKCSSSNESNGKVANKTLHKAPSVDRNFRLPLNLYPTVYEVEIQPYIYGDNSEDFFFSGHVGIEVECRSSTNEIILHSKMLHITENTIEIRLSGRHNDTINSTLEYDTDNGFIILKLSRLMVAGNRYIVEMGFDGHFSEDLDGLYLSSYVRDNSTVYLATTQFEAIHARKAFPCFDEPAIKAKFIITLVRKNHMISLSNTRIVYRENRTDNWVADHYEETPLMSTYILAFIVCDFQYTSDVTKNNVLFRSWARNEVVDQTPYSLKVGIKILAYFEDYLNISFPLAKSDMIAVPDFQAGAMENWGLITYRETNMLFHPLESSEFRKEVVANIVSHELAHMWFGNLVTPEWWGDIWLNEGFASYFEHLGVDHVHPDWNMLEEFTSPEMHRAMTMDSLVSKHPVYAHVSENRQIQSMFDDISYIKGASIIRMMRFFLGEHTFKRGLQRYLKNHLYDVATHDDLWYSLGNQSKIDRNPKFIQNIKHIMDTWVMQMNYPTVFIKRDRDKLILTQSRYLLDTEAVDPGKYESPFGYKWVIPATFTTSLNLRFNQTAKDIIWIDIYTSDVTISSAMSGSSANDWYIGNVMQYGYFRVNYPEENWIRLIQQLKTDHTLIPPINRAQIINDVWNLAKSGDVNTYIALQTLDYLPKEDNVIPLRAAWTEINYLREAVIETDLNSTFSKVMRKMLSKQFNKYGIDNTGAGHTETMTRRGIVRMACDYESEECIQNCTDIFKKYMENPNENPIDVNLRGTVYCTAVRNGGLKEYEFLERKYKASIIPSEKYTLHHALSCSKDIKILRWYLKNILHTEDIPKEDAVKAVLHISKTEIGRLPALEFIRGNWNFIFKRLVKSAHEQHNLLSGIYKVLRTAAEIEKFAYLIKDSPKMMKLNHKPGLELSNIRNKWSKRNYHNIKKWLLEKNL